MVRPGTSLSALLLLCSAASATVPMPDGRRTHSKSSSSRSSMTRHTRHTTTHTTENEPPVFQPTSTTTVSDKPPVVSVSSPNHPPSPKPESPSPRPSAPKPTTTHEMPKPSTTHEMPKPSSNTPERPMPSSNTHEMPKPSSTTHEMPKPSSTTHEKPKSSTNTHEKPMPSSNTHEKPKSTTTHDKPHTPSTMKTRATTKSDKHTMSLSSPTHATSTRSRLTTKLRTSATATTGRRTTSRPKSSTKSTTKSHTRSITRSITRSTTRSTTKPHTKSSTKSPSKTHSHTPTPTPSQMNCSDWDFEATRGQWKAYHVDDFMRDYLNKNKITDFAALRKQSWDDFMEPSEVDRYHCGIDSKKFDCPPPDRDQCEERPSERETKGWLMATAVTQFTNFLALLYDNVDSLHGSVKSDIKEIVQTNWVAAAKQTWAKIVSTTAAVMGIIVAAFVALQVILGPEVAAAGFAVAGAIAAQTAMSIAGNVGNMMDPGSSDSEFEKSTEWEKEADGMIESVKKGILALHTKETSTDNITDVLGDGRWVSKQVTESFNKDGWAEHSLKWFERVLVTQFIKKALDEEEAYIVFIPYDKEVKYNKKKWDKNPWNADYCKHHFTGNKNWNYYASCDIKMGPDGKEGMSVVTRPTKKGDGSKSWMEKPLSFNNQEIKGTDIMKSAMYGQAQHGFNFTLIDEDFIGMLSKDIKEADKFFSKTAVDQPGLYPVAVCEIEDLVYVPGIQQVMGDIYDSPGHGGYYHSGNPCPCKNYEAKKGEKKKFTDFVPKGVVDSFDKCEVTGNIRSPDDVDTSDIPVMGPM